MTCGRLHVKEDSRRADYALTRFFLYFRADQGRSWDFAKMVVSQIFCLRSRHLPILPLQMFLY